MLGCDLPTFLPAQVQGSWFYLYLILDLYSRKVKRLMGCLNTRRLHARGYRLDTLAIAGQQESRTI